MRHRKNRLMITLKPGDGSSLRVTLVNISLPSAATIASQCARIDPWRRYGVTAAELQRYLTALEPAAPRYGLHINDELAGAAGFRMNWLRGPYLQFLAIFPLYQRRGLGELVLAWFEGTAIARGERNLWVAASAFNADALRFYERHGFRRAAVLDGLIQDGLSEILLRKVL